MIIVTGTFLLNPENREKAIEVAAWMAAETQKEAGCIAYQFYADITNENRLRIYEEWESAEHLAAHFETDHMATFRNQIPTFVAAPPEVVRYEATLL